MTRQNPSENWHDLIAGYVLGDLTTEQMAKLQQKLATDPELAQELIDLQEAMSLLPYSLPEQEVPSGLKSRLLDAVHTQPAIPEVVQLKRSPYTPARSRVPWLFTLGGVAAAVIVMLGVENYLLKQQMGETEQLRQELETTRAELQNLQNRFQEMNTVVASLQQPDARVYSLEGTGPAEGAVGTLVTVPGQQEMVLISHNLPLLTEEQVYRLWAVTDQAAPPRYCGQFRHMETDLDRWTAPEALCSESPNQLLITVDGFNDPTDSAGPLVMQSRA